MINCECCKKEQGYRERFPTIMTEEDADYFANFEQGMQDYMPDQLTLCGSCASLLFSREWSKLSELGGSA